MTRRGRLRKGGADGPRAGPRAGPAPGSRRARRGFFAPRLPWRGLRPILTSVHHEFRDTVESLTLDAEPVGVTFVERRGHYGIAPAPAEVMDVLRDSLKTGRRVRVTCDASSLLIVDAIPE